MLTEAVNSLKNYCITNKNLYKEEAINYLSAFKEGNRSLLIIEEVEDIIREILEDTDLDTSIDRICVISSSINI